MFDTGSQAEAAESVITPAGVMWQRPRRTLRQRLARVGFIITAAGYCVCCWAAFIAGFVYEALGWTILAILVSVTLGCSAVAFTLAMGR